MHDIDLRADLRADRYPGNPRGMTTEERFWEKVDKSGDCWEWTGGRVSRTGKDQYGRFATSTTRGNVVLALPHRYSWELHFGQIPDGLLVLHACDNPACVRPDHLLLGTNRANSIDATRKGRIRRDSRGRILAVAAPPRSIAEAGEE